VAGTLIKTFIEYFFEPRRAQSTQRFKKVFFALFACLAVNLSK
jgi:hypothetical protein